ncbi:hypothetical protein KAJ27_20600 [bacterium]|nr:hypothetical protein [bacterium]
MVGNKKVTWDNAGKRIVIVIISVLILFTVKECVISSNNKEISNKSKETGEVLIYIERGGQGLQQFTVLASKLAKLFKPYLKGQKVDIAKFQSGCNQIELESKDILNRINQIVVPRHLKGIKQFEFVFKQYQDVEAQFFGSEMKKFVKYIKKYNPPSKKNISNLVDAFKKYAQKEA